MERSIPSRTTRRKQVWTALLLVAIVLVAWATLSPDDARLRNRERRAWKNNAVLQIEQRAADKQWLADEIERLEKKMQGRKWGSWAGDEVLLMANGEWIVCQNICRKSDPKIHDLFLGRGSDGTWYYSTFHFCKHKVVLAQERQPASIAEFADAFWLAPFDGKSDACLKLTWDGGQPWGDEKLQAAGAMPARP